MVGKIEISAKNIKNNLNIISKTINHKHKICLVMKSNAYGIGIKNIINFVIESDPNYIAVGDNQEILLLNKLIPQNSKIRILRIVPASKADILELIDNKVNNVEEICVSYEHAQILSKIAKEFNYTINIHVYFNTGMNRLGELTNLDMEKILMLKNIQIVGIMTHFFSAHLNCEVSRNNTIKQLTLFKKILGEISNTDNMIIHAANSAGIYYYGERCCFDMVRIGDLMYGFDGYQLGIKNIINSFKTEVISIINNIPKGGYIGYGLLQITNTSSPKTLATIKIGFTNGIPKNAEELGICVLIRGQIFYFIGELSMGVATIDISKQNPSNKIEIGDEVIIIGQQENLVITLDEFVEKTKRNFHETIYSICINNKIQML